MLRRPQLARVTPTLVASVLLEGRSKRMKCPFKRLYKFQSKMFLLYLCQMILQQEMVLLLQKMMSLMMSKWTLSLQVQVRCHGLTVKIEC